MTTLLKTKLPDLSVRTQPAYRYLYLDEINDTVGLDKEDHILLDESCSPSPVYTNTYTSDDLPDGTLKVKHSSHRADAVTVTRRVDGSLEERYKFRVIDSEKREIRYQGDELTIPPYVNVALLREEWYRVNGDCTYPSHTADYLDTYTALLASLAKQEDGLISLAVNGGSVRTFRNLSISAYISGVIHDGVGGNETLTYIRDFVDSSPVNCLELVGMFQSTSRALDEGSPHPNGSQIDICADPEKILSWILEYHTDNLSEDIDANDVQNPHELQNVFENITDLGNPSGEIALDIEADIGLDRLAEETLDLVTAASISYGPCPQYYLAGSGSDGGDSSASLLSTFALRQPYYNDIESKYLKQPTPVSSEFETNITTISAGSQQMHKVGVVTPNHFFVETFREVGEGTYTVEQSHRDAPSIYPVALFKEEGYGSITNLPGLNEATTSDLCLSIGDLFGLVENQSPLLYEFEEPNIRTVIKDGAAIGLINEVEKVVSEDEHKQLLNEALALTPHQTVSALRNDNGEIDLAELLDIVVGHIRREEVCPPREDIIPFFNILTDIEVTSSPS